MPGCPGGVQTCYAPTFDAPPTATTPVHITAVLQQELTPDYSMESHQRDHENYVACSRSHRRRAKALLDFERHDDDELGFRKNDVITVGVRRRGTALFPAEGCATGTP